MCAPPRLGPRGPQRNERWCPRHSVRLVSRLLSPRTEQEEEASGADDVQGVMAPEHSSTSVASGVRQRTFFRIADFLGGVVAAAAGRLTVRVGREGGSGAWMGRTGSVDLADHTYVLSEIVIASVLFAPTAVY